MTAFPKRFPNLKFGFIEVRAQWIPYMAVEIARRFDRADNSVARNLIRDNHVYVTCQTDDDLPQVLKYSGEDNIVIGSDYGHNDTSAEIEALRTIKKRAKSSRALSTRFSTTMPRRCTGFRRVAGMEYGVLE